MDIIVREMGAADRAVWAAMRAALWPEEDARALADGIDEFLGSGDCWGFMAEKRDGMAVGFAEISIRKSANGCESRPVPFLEGIWVRQDLRRLGIGARLVRHVEDFLVSRGYRELGSDALLDNSVSHESHRGWGFSETERVVYFRKDLGR